MKRKGYKICYREEGSKEYIRHFMTCTYQQALFSLSYYKRYPQRARDDDHPLKNPTWKIIPITRKEVRAGIWREVPF